MRKAIKRLLQWMRGEDDTVAGFSLLSQGIQENRTLIVKLCRQNRELEGRLWDLEPHTLEETAAMVSHRLDEWKKAGEALAAKLKKENE